MSIRIGGVSVVDNDYKLQSITGAVGVYDDFIPNRTTIGLGSLSMIWPFMTKVMNVNQNFTMSSLSPGRTAVFLLDRSTTGYTPTFSGNMYWPNGTTPTWADNRYWLISFVCFDGIRVCAAASGHDITAPETVALTDAITFASTSTEQFLSSTWEFTAGGEVIGQRTIGATTTTQHQYDWVTPTPPSGTYYLRATDVSALAQDAPSFGDALDVWHDLDISPSWQWELNPSGDTNGNILVEISTTASAAGIIDSANFQTNLIDINRAL